MRLPLVLAASFLAVGLPSAGADQAGEYVAVNPWSMSFPDCHVSGGPSVGLGGACFRVPLNATRYRVTLEDDVLGPGFGALLLCDDDGCIAEPICGGSAEGDVPAGTDRASVVVHDAFSAWTFCGLAGLAWMPSHGTITLGFTTAP